MTDEARARKRARDHERYLRMKADPEWRAKNARRYKVWKDTHRERLRTYRQAWRAKNPDKVAAQGKRYYYSPRGRLARKRWMEEGGGRELRAMTDFLRRAAMDELFRRIPDWVTKGQAVLDGDSVFLYQNLSPADQASARGYARTRAIEIRHFRDVCTRQFN